MLCLLSIDPALGRLDYTVLSDQTLMEMLIDVVDPNELQYNSIFTDVCDWDFIECKDKRVVEIEFFRLPFSDRQFPFEFIPPLVTTFWTSSNSSCGTLNPSLLPKDLVKFEFLANDLHGTLNCKAFPLKIKHIDISGNAFTGSVLLSDLPNSVTVFHASRNAFSGGLMLRDLPIGMESLDLSENRMTGPIIIDSLLPSMETIYLDDNGFTGEFRLSVIPPNLRCISIAQNNLSGTAVFPSSTGVMTFHIILDGFTSVFDTDGNSHAWEGVLVSEHSSDEEDSVDDEYSGNESYSEDDT